MFKDLEKLMGENSSLNITIAKSNEQITVSVIPKVASSDEATKKISPLVLKGTAEEMDDNFIDAISEPIEKTIGFLDNVVEYEKSLEEAKAKSKIEEDKKKENKEKEDKRKKELEKAEKLIKEEYFDKAEKIVNDVLKEMANNKKALELKKTITEAKVGKGQTDIFGATEEPIVEPIVEPIEEDLDEEDSF